jgi:hypothetical protein
MGGENLLTPEPLVTLLINLVLMSTGVLEKGALLQNAEKHKVIVHRAPRERKAYIQWGAALFPKGIINDTAITTPLPCRLRHDTFHLGLGRWVPLASMCSGNTQQGVPSTPITMSHVTQGRVEYKSKTPWSLDIGLNLWKAVVVVINLICGSLKVVTCTDWLHQTFLCEWLCFFWGGGGCEN